MARTKTPTPTHGGKRAGAGRKAKAGWTAPPVKVNLQISAEAVSALDRLHEKTGVPRGYIVDRAILAYAQQHAPVVDPVAEILGPA